MRKFWILSLVLCSSASIAETNKITLEELKTWSLKGDVVFEFYTPEITEIYLTNNEKAFLVPVSIQSGRNGMFQTALAVPSKKEVILLMDTIVKQVEGALDFDNNHVSEIFVKNSGSGQGSEIGKKAIVQLDSNGKINELIGHEFNNNRGERGKNDSRYHSEDVNWEFIHRTKDSQSVELVETITIETGVQNKDPIVKKSITYFHFDGHKLIKLEK